MREAGASPISFLGDDLWFIAVLIAAGIWQSAGYGAVIYLAALAGIDPNLYERSEEHTSELQPLVNLVCRLLLKKKNKTSYITYQPFALD